MAVNDAKGHRYRWLGALIIVMAIQSVFGCAGTYGRLDPSAEVTKTFQSYTILPGHRYYYCGPQGRPDAIIAVNDDFTLVTKAWVPFEPSSRQLRRMMDYAETHFGLDTQYSPSGYAIRAPDGREIGVWYSIWAQTIVEMLDSHAVRIYPPRTRDLPIDRDGEHSRDIP